MCYIIMQLLTVIHFIRKISKYEKSLEENLFILHKVMLYSNVTSSYGVYCMMIMYRALVLLCLE